MPNAKVNGTELFYVEVGTGIPCLVMHGGLGLDHTYLHPWLDPLSDVFRLIYYDHRGNGRSRRSSSDTFTFEQLTADADALREYLNLDKIVIMGSSVGSFLALEYALRYPNHLSGLILITAAPAWDYGQEIIANATRKGATPEMLAALDLEQCTEDAQLRQGLSLLAPLYFHSYDPNVFAQLLKDTVLSGKATGMFGRQLRSYNVVPHLPEISAQTLIIMGKDDFIMPPSQGERLQKGIPGATLVVMEKSGHFPFVEEPDLFFASVREWLEKTDHHTSSPNS